MHRKLPLPPQTESITTFPLPRKGQRVLYNFPLRSLTHSTHIVQELCESRGGRPELSVLTGLLVSVDVKNY